MKQLIAEDEGAPSYYCATETVGGITIGAESIDWMASRRGRYFARNYMIAELECKSTRLGRAGTRSVLDDCLRMRQAIRIIERLTHEMEELETKEEFDDFEATLTMPVNTSIGEEDVPCPEPFPVSDFVATSPIAHVAGYPHPRLVVKGQVMSRVGAEALIANIRHCVKEYPEIDPQ